MVSQPYGPNYQHINRTYLLIILLSGDEFSSSLDRLSSRLGGGLRGVTRKNCVENTTGDNGTNTTEDESIVGGLGTIRLSRVLA